MPEGSEEIAGPELSGSLGWALRGPVEPAGKDRGAQVLTGREYGAPKGGSAGGGPAGFGAHPSKQARKLEYIQASRGDG